MNIGRSGIERIRRIEFRVLQSVRIYFSEQGFDRGVEQIRTFLDSLYPVRGMAERNAW